MVVNKLAYKERLQGEELEKRSNKRQCEEGDVLYIRFLVKKRVIVRKKREKKVTVLRKKDMLEFIQQEKKQGVKLKVDNNLTVDKYREKFVKYVHENYSDYDK